jgi:beta-glucosidase
MTARSLGRGSLLALLLAGAAATGGCTATPTPPSTEATAQPWLDPARPAEERADLALAAMTQDEKLGLVFGYFATDFPSKDYQRPPESREGSAGYVPGIPRLGIPPQWETDAGIGVASQGGAKDKRGRTALPSGIATTATWNPELAHAGGAMIGAEARASGFNVMLAGGANLMRDPRNGRNFEYGGEDPLLAGVMVGSQIAGIQSNHIVSTLKHYALNDHETGRDTGNVVIDDAAARMSDLLAFEIAMETGDPHSVMCSYNLVNGTHACENSYLLTDVLRRDWGFKGYVMSDWGATHSTVAAAKAGLDQESGFPFDEAPYFGAPLKAAIESGMVPEAQLDAMARHILTALFASGAVDHPVAPGPIDLAAHAAVTRADAEQGIVLLRNEGAILPLSPSVGSIAVIGGHADKGVLAGGGSSLVYPREGNAVPGIEPTGWPGPVMYYPSAPLDAIRAQAPNARVTFVDGSDPAAAAAAAKAADVAIVFATQWAGESFDVPLMLPDNQDALIGAVAKANPKTVVVLETGGPVLMPWAEQVGASLEAWYPGTEGGSAIANVLFGKVNPSGHLPATFPASLDQLVRPGEITPDVRLTEGATVGYKWYDAKGLTPRYAFGHGLSYTSFAQEGLSASAEDGTITARFRVRNTGDREGMDVAQLYVARVAGGWVAPKRLAGWKKVDLKPGETTDVSLTVDPRLLAVWDGGAWKIAGGAYKVMLARSARDIGETVTVQVPARTLPAGWHP